MAMDFFVFCIFVCVCNIYYVCLCHSVLMLIETHQKPKASKYAVDIKGSVHPIILSVSLRKLLYAVRLWQRESFFKLH